LLLITKKNLASLLTISEIFGSDPRLQEFKTEAKFLISIANLPKEKLSILLSQPGTFYWSRVAYELLGTFLHPDKKTELTKQYFIDANISDIRSALAFHLKQMYRFFETPTEDSYVEINYSGYELRLQPSAFCNLPGLPVLNEIKSVNLDYQKQNKQLVIDSLKLIEKFQPEVFKEFQERMFLLALKPYEVATFDNTTHPLLPGASILSVVKNPLEFCESLIHELNHNKLHEIEEINSIYGEMSFNPYYENLFYSSVRNEKRPLHGILHAAYVLTAVLEFWRTVNQTQEVSEKNRAYATIRIQALTKQTQQCLHELENGVYTEFGSSLVKHISQRVMNKDRK
jgi:hypothetical protein